MSFLLMLLEIVGTAGLKAALATDVRRVLVCFLLVLLQVLGPVGLASTQVAEAP